MTLIDTLQSITGSWNSAVDALSMHPCRYEQMLKDLQRLNVVSLRHRKPLAEHIRGKLSTGQTVYILAGGSHTCTCPAGSEHPRRLCKHVAKVAAVSLKHYFERGRKW